MTLKSRIQAEYVSAFKNREMVKKNLSGVLRGEITTLEKNTGTADLSDAEITKLSLKYKKNIEETRKHRETPDLALEQQVVESFLPSPLSEDVIRREIKEIIKTLPLTLPINALVGKTIGEFNKKFAGAADSRFVMSIIQETLS